MSPRNVKDNSLRGKTVVKTGRSVLCGPIRVMRPHSSESRPIPRKIKTAQTVSETR